MKDLYYEDRMEYNLLDYLFKQNGYIHPLYILPQDGSSPSIFSTRYFIWYILD